MWRERGKQQNPSHITNYVSQDSKRNLRNMNQELWALKHDEGVAFIEGERGEQFKNPSYRETCRRKSENYLYAIIYLKKVSDSEFVVYINEHYMQQIRVHGHLLNI